MSLFKKARISRQEEADRRHRAERAAPDGGEPSSAPARARRGQGALFGSHLDA